MMVSTWFIKQRKQESDGGSDDELHPRLDPG